MAETRLVVIGQVAKPFGIKGEVKIASYVEDMEVFERSRVLVLGQIPYNVVSIRFHKAAVLATLERVDTPEAAAELAGMLVKTAADNLPPKGEDEYYWFELIGMRVATVQGRDLGTITRITPTGANDVLHVEGPTGEVLLPWIEEVVVEVNTESKVVIVDPLEGLVPDA
jgi:16S rRNA processing protein RimM